MDEPTTGLTRYGKGFSGVCKGGKGSGEKCLAVQPLLSEVEKLCDRIAIIREGKIIETGTLSEMRHLTRTNLTIKPKNRLLL
ncbi:MAG: hypothetical protein RJR35_05835 [Thermoanaerobacterales bacterium]|nr:hypothetical protein [Thermoanaerobacterales bacterium]